MAVTVKIDHLILPAQVTGQFTMSSDEFLGKCQARAATWRYMPRQ